MNRLLSTAMLTCMAVASTSASAATRVGDFALLDSQGEFHKMSYYDDHKAIALLVQGNGGATEKSLVDFKAAREKYKDQVKFFMINSLATPRDAVQIQVKQYDTDIRVLMDDTQLISEAMGVDKAGEVFLLDPKSFTVLYRGPADAALNTAIDEVLAGHIVSKAVVRTKGEKVVYTKQMNAKSISYAKDIAPILAENCARCHREGGVAPFAMNSHAVIRGFAPMIREVVLTKRMPPGQIDPYVGHFKNTYALTPTQTQKLVHWINAGAKKDGTADPLSELRWPESRWALGQPDLIIKLPPQKIPATGVLSLIDVNVPIEGMDRDRYVRASEYIPSDRSVLHHTVTTVLPPEANGAQGSVFSYNLDAARISPYIPGTQALIEPPNTGGLLKKGSSLALNLHYTTTGKATTDSGEIGVWFYPDDQIPKERMTVECACILNMGWKPIPPFSDNHEMKRTITVAKDALLYSIAPHMHFRGKRMRFSIAYPDGTQEELLNVANYQYNWQLTYELAEPKRLPAGAKITAIAAFDNSVQNKANPDPSRRVPFGEQSWDEMFISAITLKYVEPNTLQSSR